MKLVETETTDCHLERLYFTLWVTRKYPPVLRGALLTFLLEVRKTSTNLAYAEMVI